MQFGFQQQPLDTMGECAEKEDEVKLKLAFCKWLTDNGAKFPKIIWPSSDTVSGIRGAIASSTIATNEHMVEIPVHLMMSPPIIFADAQIGIKLRSVKDLLDQDMLIAIFIMHELRKGDASFYAPFLKILPEPGNISEWTDEDIQLLQVMKWRYII